MPRLMSWNVKAKKQEGIRSPDIKFSRFWQAYLAQSVTGAMCIQQWSTFGVCQKPEGGKSVEGSLEVQQEM